MALLGLGHVDFIIHTALPCFLWAGRVLDLEPPLYVLAYISDGIYGYFGTL